jgi:hypothetical protein
MTAITSASSFATRCAEIRAMTVDASTAKNVFAVAKGAAYEGRSLTGLSPTDSASVQANAIALEDWANRSVQPYINTP